MIDAGEVYVIQNTHNGGYWDGKRWSEILFCNRYTSHRAALAVVNTILNKPSGSIREVTYLEIKQLFTI